MTINSLQRIFDAAWQHFIVENNLPAKDGMRCKYLTKDGRKCAVGLCIPDGHDAQKSNSSFGLLIRDYPELFPDLVDYNGRYALDTFQRRLHDSLTGSVGWEYSLEKRTAEYLKVAEDYNLTVNTPRVNECDNFTKHCQTGISKTYE